MKALIVLALAAAAAAVFALPRPAPEPEPELAQGPIPQIVIIGHRSDVDERDR